MHGGVPTLNCVREISTSCIISLGTGWVGGTGILRHIVSLMGLILHGTIDGHLICFVLKHVCMYVCMLVRGEGLVG